MLERHGIAGTEIVNNLSHLKDNSKKISQKAVEGNAKRMI